MTRAMGPKAAHWIRQLVEQAREDARAQAHAPQEQSRTATGTRELKPEKALRKARENAPDRHRAPGRTNELGMTL
ncbi:hypothetical protein IHV25_07085 [Phaeovibrio sulfidiphilus]|uniref:Uncharacterized protein n=1 Tax=Phaeovibrio sulfidiphilus TaxID=1220600 RepID=A0A8J7CR25_9PROT|nr:hypothetical protein [Phaeovibrio sulfidiphilus]MBE1237410.1 hypothetical protein [Phaeovibrio sulfidiphilus]